MKEKIGHLLIWALPLILVILMLLFGNPFSNLYDWQIGLFGIIFAFALIGLNSLLYRK